MSYSEKNLPIIKPKIAFLITLGLILLCYCVYTVIFRVIGLTSYRSVFQILTLALAGGAVFYLYRYSIISHEYRIEDDTFFIIRTDGSRINTIVAAKNADVLLLCPVLYAGPDIPGGDFVTVNACSAHSAKRSGWALYCSVGNGGKLVKVVFNPSEQLVEKLGELFPGKLSK